MSQRSETIEKFIEFSRESFDWCMAESDKEVSRINDVLYFVIEDATRRIKMTDKAKKALQDLTTRQIETASSKGVNAILKSLHDIMTEEKELQNTLDPIVNALQFQDRYRQNLLNLSNMLTVWKEHRDKGPINEEEFVADISKHTTMSEEREILKKFFDSVPEEEKTDADVTFF